jgi:hypothetical protein
MYLIYNHIIDSDISLDAPLVNGAPDLIIRAAKFNLPLSQKTKIFRNDINAEYAEKAGHHYLIWHNAVAFKINEAEISYLLLGEIPNGLLEVFLLSEALGTWLFLKGKFLLHGGAVSYGKKSMVFLGKPGTGKSTTVSSFALNGAKMLADDMVVIDTEEINNIYILPSNLPMKLWEDTAISLGFKTKHLKPAWEGKNKYYVPLEHQFKIGEKVHLSEIFILEKPFSKKTIKLTHQQEHIELLSYFPLAHQLLTGKYLLQYFQMINIIISKTQIKRKKRPKNFDKLDKWVKLELNN